MYRLTSAVCWWILGTGLVLAQPAEQVQKQLEGTWIATKAERDGKAADDVVGHRLSFTGNRFQIQSKDGKPLTREPSVWTRARSRRPLTSSMRKGS
jgi:uncharacterized protein (TIGR03067 family)